jgi:hypothetical protein
VPLGPREAYRPPYRASSTYVRNINNMRANAVTNQSVVDNYVNRHAATVVPMSAMSLSQPVSRHLEHLPPQAVEAGRAGFLPGVRPSTATLGVTPAAARQLSLPPGGPGRPASPGPALRSPGFAAGHDAPPAGRGLSPAGAAAVGAAAGGAAALGGAMLRNRPRDDFPPSAPGPAIVPRAGSPPELRQGGPNSPAFRPQPGGEMRQPGAFAQPHPPSNLPRADQRLEPRPEIRQPEPMAQRPQPMRPELMRPELMRQERMRQEPMLQRERPEFRRPDPMPQHMSAPAPHMAPQMAPQMPPRMAPQHEAQRPPPQRETPHRGCGPGVRGC